jgi:uncharacterized membrane protein
MQEKNIYKIFEISLLVKGVQAVLELVLGALFFFVSTGSVTSFIQMLTKAELIENSNDVVYRYIFQAAQHFSVTDKSFLALYLLSHGLVKAVLIGGIIKNKAWAYPSFLVVQALFIAYQIYESFHRYSLLFAVWTVFDVIIFWFVWHEYKLKKRHHVLK